MSRLEALMVTAAWYIALLAYSIKIQSVELWVFVATMFIVYITIIMAHEPQNKNRR